MKTTLKNLLLIALVISSLSACKKKNNDTSDDTQNSGLPGQLHKITSGGTDLVVYSYDSTGKLTKQVINNGGGQTMTINYTYNNSKLSEETGKYNGSIAYQYTYTYLQNGKLDKCNIVGATQSYWQMHYDNQGKIDYAVEYIGGGESKKMTFDYNSDNIVEATLYDQFGGWQQEKRFEFEYDNKHNPMQELGIPFSEVIDENADLLSPNNTTRIKEYDDNNILVNDTQYQYNYNADLYPTSATENNTTNYEFIYY